MGLCVLDTQADIPLVRLPVSRAALVRLAACPSLTRRGAPPRAHAPLPLQTQHDGLPFRARTRRAPGSSALVVIVGLRVFCVCGERSPFPTTQQLSKLLPCPREGTLWWLHWGGPTSQTVAHRGLLVVWAGAVLCPGCGKDPSLCPQFSGGERLLTNK